MVFRLPQTNGSKTLSQKLQKLQNRAARVITFSNNDRNTDELLRMVNWVKLDRQRLVNKSIMMYKIVNNMVIWLYQLS